MAVRSLSGVRASEVNPSFLHANSTSHTWIFSAIAELVDNAYDPDVNATQLWIEKRMINGQVTLVFVDNGNGMDPDKLHKMLSFGFSDKQEIRGHRPIGQYGNGFKSGSMRLGKDVLVFTRQKSSMSVGFLSQSYLRAINAKTVFVPMVTWRLPSKQMVHTQECFSSLKEILRYSIFRTERSIIQELDALGCIGESGTEIIIYNLKRDRHGNLELDFESDANDILNPETSELDRSTMYRPVSEPTALYKKSLREYCSILFLKPRMKMMLRGEKVKTKLISKSLSRTEKDIYKPHFLPKPVKIILGFSPNPENYGILMYHKNRLITAYEKVGYQKQANELGVGVVGVVELNFLEPIHNKQDFNKTTQYHSCINALGVKLNEYWNEKTRGTPTGPGQLQPKSRPPDWLWAQCDKCLKWRRLPPAIRDKELPKKWFCQMNMDQTHNRCDIPEESEDDEDIMMRPSYEKTFKKEQEERRRQQRIEQMRQLQNREKQLQMKEDELRRMRMSVQQVDLTADKKPTDEDLMKAQRALTEAKEREAQQTKLIQQLQQQKDLLEKKQRDVLKIAESLTIKQLQDTEKPPGQPDQSPTASGAGQKRPLEGGDDHDDANKRVRVVTNDGEVVYVVQRDGQKKVGKDAALIDLTLSDEEADAASASTSKDDTQTPGVMPKSSEYSELKPDIAELDRRIAEAKQALGASGDACIAQASTSGDACIAQAGTPADANTAAAEIGGTTQNQVNGSSSGAGEPAEDTEMGQTEGKTTDGETNAEESGRVRTKVKTEPEDTEGVEEEFIPDMPDDDNDDDDFPMDDNDLDDFDDEIDDELGIEKSDKDAQKELNGEAGEKEGSEETMETETSEDKPSDGSEEKTEDGSSDIEKPESSEEKAETSGEKAETSGEKADLSGPANPEGSEQQGKDGSADEDKPGMPGASSEATELNGASPAPPELQREGSVEGEKSAESPDVPASPSEPGEDKTKHKEDLKTLAKTEDKTDIKTSADPSKPKSPEDDKKEVKNELKKEGKAESESHTGKPMANGELKSTKSHLKLPHLKPGKIVKTRGVQTLPVEIKGMLTDSLNFSKLAPHEVHHLLVQRTNDLEGLRKNVRDLLHIILPEVDIGTPDSIDQVVQEVIRVNQIEASSSTSVDK